MSEELWRVAARAMGVNGAGAQAYAMDVLNAVVPRIKAECFREAAGELHYDDWRVAERLRARADALDPSHSVPENDDGSGDVTDEMVEAAQLLLLREGNVWAETVRRALEAALAAKERRP